MCSIERALLLLVGGGRRLQRHDGRSHSLGAQGGGIPGFPRLVGPADSGGHPSSRRDVRQVGLPLQARVPAGRREAAGLRLFHLAGLGHVVCTEPRRPAAGHEGSAAAHRTRRGSDRGGKPPPRLVGLPERAVCRTDAPGRGEEPAHLQCQRRAFHRAPGCDRHGLSAGL